jgi:hypothetical protein
VYVSTLISVCEPDVIYVCVPNVVYVCVCDVVFYCECILLSVSVHNIISDPSYVISVHVYNVLSASTFDVITILYLISYLSVYVCVYNIILLYVSDFIFIYVHLMSVCHICVSFVLCNSYLLYILWYSSQCNTSTSAMAATSVTAVASSPIPVETRLVLVRQSIVYNSMSVATQVRSNVRHLVSGCYSYV